MLPDCQTVPDCEFLPDCQTASARLEPGLPCNSFRNDVILIGFSFDNLLSLCGRFMNILAFAYVVLRVLFVLLCNDSYFV